MGGDVRRSQPPGFSCGGPASSTPFVVGSSSAAVETGESSAPPSPPAAPAPAPPEPPSSPSAPSPSFSGDNDNTSVIRNVTLDNSSVLDCCKCHHPVKPPIFQCSLGHVVCAPCHDEPTPATSRCHVCRIPLHGGYSRCNAMEQVVDSLRVPCPHDDAIATHGFSSSVIIRDVTVENSSALDCGICYLPLKPPIYQCTVGHVACSPCDDKLAAAARRRPRRCHVCRAPAPGGYARCRAMEQVVDAVRVPCPHAGHGCAAKPAYHGRDAHAQACAHRPCRCPVEGCGYAGSVRTTLPAHLATAHGWPFTAGRAGISHGLEVRLRKGFNVVVVAAAASAAAADDQEEEQYMLVLNVERAPVCNAINALCVNPSRAGTVMIGLSYYRRWRPPDSGGAFSRYVQSSQLGVVCTDLSDGMQPGASSCCFAFLVPAAAPGGEDGDDISVTFNYIRAT